MNKKKFKCKKRGPCSSLSLLTNEPRTLTMQLPLCQNVAKHRPSGPLAEDQGAAGHTF